MRFLFFREKNLLDEFSLDELKEMQIKLDHKSDNLRRDIEAIESEVASLFEKAKAAKTKTDEISLAQRIKTLEQKKAMKQKAHAEIEKELRAVSNVAIIREHEEDLKAAGIWGKLKKMDPEKLEHALTEKVLDSQDRDQLVTGVINMTREAMTPEPEHDEDLEEILEAIHMIKKGELAPEEAKKKVSMEREE